jgi:hypothetical protein
MSQFVFQKATKNQLPARICIAGPTGSGKTYTATLEMAPVLGERRLQVDTEHGSGALYADQGDYDYYRFDPPYDPARLVEVLQAADEQGYNVIIVDSLSHFWDGEGGTIDIADAAGQRASGNSFAGWKVATPALRHLVDVMLDLKAHLIVTMRSKMEYVLETNERGKQVPRKVGMAPVMRQGIEYEFALVGDMDLDHRMVISKSRCSELADLVVQPHRAKEMTETFKAWLNSGAAMAAPEQIAKIRGVFDGVLNLEVRKLAKKAFFDVYGDPDRLTEAKVAEALEFAQKLAAPIDAAPEPQTEGAGELSAEGQMSKAQKARLDHMFVLFGKAKITDRDARLVYCGRVVGHDVATSNDLTVAEVGQIVGQLKVDTGEEPPAREEDAA